MKISRHVPVSGRIIKEDDITRILKLFASERDILAEKSKRIKFLLKGQFDDGIIFESDDINEFESSELIKIKRLLSIDISLNDFENNLNINVSLSHGGSGYRNGISINGTDANWVNSLSVRLKECIEASAPQTSFISRYKTMLQILIAMGIGRLFKWFFDFIFLMLFTMFPPAIPKNPPEWLITSASFFKANPALFHIFDYIIFLPAGWFPAELLLLSKYEKWWPSVEFQIGPSHTFIEKQRRHAMYAIFSFGIAPLLASLIYDILKSFK